MKFLAAAAIISEQGCDKNKHVIVVRFASEYETMTLTFCLSLYKPSILILIYPTLFTTLAVYSPVAMYSLQFIKKKNLLQTLPQGWDDVGFHGSEITTPNIDALAYSGIILNKYYVSPICSPTRSAIMTGRHPIHTGMGPLGISSNCFCFKL